MQLYPLIVKRGRSLVTPAHPSASNPSRAGPLVYHTDSSDGGSSGRGDVCLPIMAAAPGAPLYRGQPSALNGNPRLGTASDKVSSITQTLFQNTERAVNQRRTPYQAGGKRTGIPRSEFYHLFCKPAVARGDARYRGSERRAVAAGASLPAPRCAQNRRLR